MHAGGSTEHLLQIAKSKSPRDNDRWANWLDPFIDTLTPTFEIKSAHGTARQILDHYARRHPQGSQRTQPKRPTRRRTLPEIRITGNSNSSSSRPITSPSQIPPPPDTFSTTSPPYPSTPPRTPHDSGHPDTAPFPMPQVTRRCQHPKTTPTRDPCSQRPATTAHHPVLEQTYQPTTCPTFCAYNTHKSYYNPPGVAAGRPQSSYDRVAVLPLRSASSVQMFCFSPVLLTLCLGRAFHT